MKKKYRILILAISLILCLSIFFIQRNKIVGTVYGPEMQKIVINEVSYVWDNETPYSGTDKSFHIGKGAWQDGTRVVDLYKIKGDKDFNYLYARHGYEGKMYVREQLK